MDENENIISLVDVTKIFDKTFTAVDNVSLDIKRGEFVTLLGPSGCGKTTILRMIGGFDIPTSGKIMLGNEEITNLPPYKRPINTVFQHYALFPNLDVYDNIAFGLKLKKIPYETTDRKGRKVTKYKKLSAEEIDEKVANALKLVNLSEMEDRDIHNLSGGQQQRVAIARAIVNEPKVLLLDEPLSALDHKMRLDMQMELKEMHRKLGITFIYVTHDQEEALSMSDKIVIMKSGSIQQIGTPEQIYNEPVSAYVADFIGESNIYGATMSGKKKVRFLSASWDCIDDFPLNEKVDVVIRPEDVLLGKKDKGTINAKIISKVFKGEDYSYVLKVGKNEVLCRDKKSFNVGDEVSISIEDENIQVMHKELTENRWDDAEIDRNGNLIIGEDSFSCNIEQLVPNGKLEEEGSSIVIDQKTHRKYDFQDAILIATCPFNAITLSDDLESGSAKGRIVSAVWIGDHYQYLVRTEEEEDFVVDSEETRNEGDIVSVEIAKEKITLKLKKDLNEYGEDL